MKQVISVHPDSLLSMEPEELTNYLMNEMNIELPSSAVSFEERRQLASALNEATAFFNYFSEMELRAKNRKRTLKRNKAEKEQVDNMLGVEETFRAFKEMSKAYIDNIARLMTLKRLDLDDAKIMGEQT